MPVSVIIPTYNDGQLLGEALDSVLSQTQPPAQLIVVDDGSSDGTDTVLARYAAHILSFKQPNAGPAGARNRGLAHATGRYIAFLDADDAWTPNCLAVQLDALRGGDADIAWGLSDRLPHAHGAAVEDWNGLPQWALSLGSMMFRRGTPCGALRFDESLRGGGEDFDLFLRLKEAGARIKKHPHLVQRVRLHGDNHFSLDPEAMKAAHFAAIKHAFARKRQKRPAE